jgi:hypothetical protein
MYFKKTLSNSCARNILIKYVANYFAAKLYMKPHVKTVIIELLNLIRETENDDLTGTMQRLVCTYVEEVTPIAVEMMSHLVSLFIYSLLSTLNISCCMKTSC